MMRPLRALAGLADGAACGVEPAPGGPAGLILVRRGDKVHAYVNACPHIGVPLNLLPGQFLSADGTVILCATHGAAFRIEDGLCLRGPCAGDRLEEVPVVIRNGMVCMRSTIEPEGAHPGDDS